ncbi:hypothetical protein A9Q81_12980 [Gammaproteobacteria bacterium 42_54_T18]|nr:hypothetical protein A9Q81_12980 [Gammaproteobacteria bacterium 42_54_T18]
MSGVSVSVGLDLKFDGLSNTLMVNLKYLEAKEDLVYSIKYGKNALDISYSTTNKTAQASWLASDGEGLKLSELATLIGIPEAQELASLDLALKGFSLDYDDKEGLFFIDVALESGSNAFLAAVKPQGQVKKWQFALGFYLNDTLSLSELPLVGKELGNRFSIKDIHLAYITQEMSTATLITISQLLKKNNINTLNKGADNTVPKGITAGATFNFGNIIPSKNLFSTSKATPPSGANAKSRHASVSTSANSHAKVGKSIGPVHVQSFGFGFSKGDINVKISAGVAVGPLSMSLEGLTIGNPLTKLDPTFSLNGLTIDMKSDPITLGGGFLKVDPPSAGTKYEYEGMLNLSLKSFQLDAYGSYAKLNNDDTSLFVYAIADYPLGGPSFFFVTGLAAAFGYNRNLIAPDVTGVATYPLVTAAAGNNTTNHPSGSDAAAQSGQILSQLEKYLPPEDGEYFIGLGVKFQSFKIIDSFALLIGKFGKQLAFDFFAVSTYRAPDPEDPSPVAVVELEVIGQLIPAEGTLMVQGQLTPSSFLLDKDCHLTGGFAVGLWATGQYAGDFVYSFGGYGSHYTPPAHYPQQVPVIGLSWQLSSELSIKGGMYWAITPKMITAGGFMHASLNTSFFKAWFDLDAYFLIEWKPFHYEAGFHVDFGLKVRIDLLFTSIWLGFDISAGLQIQGPPFSGVASISLSVCTIHVHFGAAAVAPPPLTWNQFDTAFLPKQSDRVNINLTAGLVKTVKDQDNNSVWVINPKEFRLETNSFIPSTEYQINYQEIGQTQKTAIIDNKPMFNKPAIAPMTLATGGFSSAHNITLIGPDGDCELQAFAITQNSPKAIWGDKSKADESTSLISDVLTGFRLVPAKEPTPGITQAVNKNTLAWELDVFNQAFEQDKLLSFKGKKNIDVKTFIDGTSDARHAVLLALGVTDNIPSASDLKDTFNFDFVPNIIIGNYSE